MSNREREHQRPAGMTVALPNHEKRWDTSVSWYDRDGMVCCPICHLGSDGVVRSMPCGIIWPVMVYGALSLARTRSDNKITQALARSKAR